MPLAASSQNIRKPSAEVAQQVQRGAESGVENRARTRQPDWQGGSRSGPRRRLRALADEEDQHGEQEAQAAGDLQDQAVVGAVAAGLGVVHGADDAHALDQMFRQRTFAGGGRRARSRRRSGTPSWSAVITSP